MSVADSFLAAVAAARHVDADGVDAATVAAGLALAQKIDAWDEIVQWAIEDAADSESRPKVPANDNTSLPTFLRYCEALGLTPGSRRALTGDKAVEVDPIDELKKRREAKRRAAG